MENIFIGKDIDEDNNKGWRLYNIFLLDEFNSSAIKMFPTLVSLIKETPEIKACVISILDEKTEIPEHVGYYKGVMSYMLSLKIPKDRENVYLCVNGHQYNWKEGGGILWDDTFSHSVINIS